MATYKAEIGGYDVSLRIDYNGKLSFVCEVVGEFDSEDAIEAALKKYDLSLRKEFTNRVAYRRGGWALDGKLEKVEVTSADDKEAWVKNEKGRREKCQRVSLFSDRDEYYAAAEKATALRDEAERIMAAVPRWQPSAATPEAK